MGEETTETTVTIERRGHVLLMGLNRPTRRNAFTLQMFEQLALAYGELERDPDLRCGVLFAHGEHFTGGLDLAQVAPAVIDGNGLPVPEGGRQPWRLDGPWTTPVVIAVQGWCITIGIELLLAADVRIAADDTRFAQLEVQRGIYPFAGATIRMPREAGWGNAMKHLLTGDPFDAHEAHRMGLVQEVVPSERSSTARSSSPSGSPPPPHRSASPRPCAPPTAQPTRATTPRSRSCRPTPSHCSPARTAPRACAPLSSAARPDSAGAERHNMKRVVRPATSAYP